MPRQTNCAAADVPTRIWRLSRSKKVGSAISTDLPATGLRLLNPGPSQKAMPQRIAVTAAVITGVSMGDAGFCVCNAATTKLKKSETQKIAPVNGTADLNDSALNIKANAKLTRRARRTGYRNHTSLSR